MAARNAFTLFDWQNSREAIADLEKLLQCTACKKIPEDPQHLGRCSHHFCRSCVDGLENGTCPLCKVPAPPKEMQPDRIVSDLIISCKELRELIGADDVQSETPNDQCTPASLCTPKKNIRPSLPLKNPKPAVTTANNNSSNDDNNNSSSNRNTTNNNDNSNNNTAQSPLPQLPPPLKNKLEEDKELKAAKKAKAVRKIPVPKTLSNSSSKNKSTKTTTTSNNSGRNKNANNTTTTAMATTIIKDNGSTTLQLLEVTPLKSRLTKKESVKKAKTVQERTVSKIPSTSSMKKAETKVISTPESKKLPKLADLSALGMSPKSHTINKRNAKGETLLHVSCIKGEKEKVKQLLAEGANPNTKDNAGWTPLHEACSHGFEDIAELLLHHGSVVDAVGGSNETPLHDAVEHGQLGLIKLLRGWGASDTVRNIQGHTPRSLAALCNGASEINAALDTPVSQSVPQPPAVPPLMDKMTLLGTGLSRQQSKKLDTLAKMLRAKLVTEFSPEVTHIVTECNNDKVVIQRTVKYMMGVVSGKWIISQTWMDECVRSKSAMSPLEHEARGCSLTPELGAPTRGRENAEKLRPGLFSGCSMFLWGVFTEPSKKEVESLVRAGDGTVLAREPNAEGIIEDKRTVPFHANPTDGLGNCSHYIIYPDNALQPLIKYDMSHIKSLPLSWLYTCVDNFALVLPEKQTLPSNTTSSE